MSEIKIPKADYAVVGGVPAKVIKMLDSDQMKD